MALAGFFLVLSCAGPGRTGYPASSELEGEELRLQETFDRILYVLNHRQGPDSLKPFLSEGSREWIAEMEYAASFEQRTQLEQRPFDQMLVILSLRLMDRHGHLRNVVKDSLLHLAMGASSPLKRAMSLKLGPSTVRNERGFRGLAKTPLVPLLHFVKEDNQWKFDLPSTMPLVARGLETIGPKKRWSPTRTVLYLLGKAYRLPAEEDLFDP